MTKDRHLMKMISMEGHEGRLSLMFRIAGQFESGLAYWKAMRTVWSTSEIFAHHRDELHDLMGKHPRCRPSFMSLQERKVLAEQPDLITVYRGTCELNPMGWSWTLDEEMAQWFAHRWPVGTESFVLQGQVDKSKVIGLLTLRGESEIVVRPWDVMGAFRIHDYGNLWMSASDRLGYLLRTGQFDWSPQPTEAPSQ